MVSSQLSQMPEGRVGSAHTLIGIYGSPRVNILCWNCSNRYRLLLRPGIVPLRFVRYHTIGLLDWSSPLVVARWAASSIPCNQISVHKAQSPRR